MEIKVNLKSVDLLYRIILIAHGIVYKLSKCLFFFVSNANGQVGCFTVT